VTDEDARNLRLSSKRGVLIGGLDDKGPAKAAGLQVSDLILRVGGIEPRDPQHLVEIVSNLPPGQEVWIAFLRAGWEEMLLVRLGDFADRNKP
jgi:serine protease Do